MTHEPNGNEDRDRAEYSNEIENNHGTEIENEIKSQNEHISLIEHESLIQSECERQIRKVTRTIIVLITSICPVHAGTDHTV